MHESAPTITSRLAACIYFADMELQGRPTVLWDMLPALQQIWYVYAASEVLHHAAEKKTRVPRRPRTDRPPAIDDQPPTAA